MARMIFSAVIAVAALLSAAPAPAQSNTRDQIRMIEQEYAHQNNGEVIPDNQLEYYLDRAHDGWTMGQISSDIAQSARQYVDTPWRPQPGWVATEVVCTSLNSQYRECTAPFNGRANVTEQISNAACIEGQSWGQKPGVIWVNRGCRARFGIVAAADVPPPVVTPYPVDPPLRRMVACQSYRGRYRTCATGFPGPVVLSRRFPNSAACIAGRTWGQRPGQVWVTRGCRAQFASVNRPVPGHEGGPWDNNYSVTCSSSGPQVACVWDDRYGRPRIDQQLSQAACIEGQTWGYVGPHSVWVSGGCRARFIGSQANPGAGNGGWNRDPNYMVTCSSDRNDMTRCNWDARYGAPRVIQQLSQAACVQGSSWGFDNQNGLWVDHGCRAQFGAR